MPGGLGRGTREVRGGQPCGRPAVRGVTALAEAAFESWLSANSEVVPTASLRQYRWRFTEFVVEQCRSDDKGEQ